jgi:hypothetical protein
MTGARRPQGVRALLWLRSREWLGESRDPVRLVFFAVLVVGWFALTIVGAIVAARLHRVEPVRDLLYVGAAAWPLWAVVPLLGGGGGEVVASHRLAPYPVSSRAVFGAAWLTALVDVPVLVVLPLVLGLATALAGPAGLVAALGFAAGASGCGQLAAWVSSIVLSGRKHTGVAALVLTCAVVGMLGAAPLLVSTAVRAAHTLPGGWLDNAAVAAHHGRWGVYAGWLGASASPALLAVLVGPWLAGRALDREARSGGAGARTWGTETWVVRGSVLRALTVTSIRSMMRAIGAQVALAGVLAVPAITRLPGLDFAQVSLLAMGGVAGIAAATVLGVNAFAFDAGGAALLLSWPVRPRDVVIAKAIAVGFALYVGQVAVTCVGAFALHSTSQQILRALVLALARSAALTGLSVVWSVRAPQPSDYDSLRARISSPRSILTFVTAASFVTYGVSQGAHDLPGARGEIVLLLAGAWVAAAGILAATQDFRAAGLERVAAGVRG